MKKIETSTNLKNTRLFSYKMTDDTGFAPNQFKDFLTLANCKSKMRKYRTQSGDWVAGFSSVKLNKDPVGHERLVYLMEIKYKVVYKEYWTNTKYECKKPITNSENFEDKAGDNIYKPNKNAPLGFEQIKETIHHNNNNDQNDDLAGEYVLISKNFYYFGSSPINISNCGQKLNIPKGVCPYGLITDNAQKFITYIEKNYKKGINANPHKWKDTQINKGCSSCK